jgi:hypothetical protein
VGALTAPTSASSYAAVFGVSQQDTIRPQRDVEVAWLTEVEHYQPRIEPQGEDGQARY